MCAQERAVGFMKEQGAGLELYHTHTCTRNRFDECRLHIQPAVNQPLRGSWHTFGLCTKHNNQRALPGAGVRGTTQVEVTCRGVIMLWAGHNKTEGNPLKANQ